MEIGATSHKIVVVLNKRLEQGVALNAAAHMALGLSALAANEGPRLMESLKFLRFVDRDGEAHPSISALSLVVLKGTSSEIRKFRAQLREKQILSVDFTDTMTGGTYVEQLERMSNTTEDELQYYGICAFGTKTELEPLSRRFSLWR